MGDGGIIDVRSPGQTRFLHEFEAWLEMGLHSPSCSRSREIALVQQARMDLLKSGPEFAPYAMRAMTMVVRALGGGLAQPQRARLAAAQE
ncbi:MAG: hypothetical protein ABGX04_06575 [Myxococcales bacterium]|nr:hypothetical protein [Myxococcales bacterium]HIK86053.1 hypothetical protein [Myxococcales bacterium]